MPPMMKWPDEDVEDQGFNGSDFNTPIEYRIMENEILMLGREKLLSSIMIPRSFKNNLDQSFQKIFPELFVCCINML